MLLCYAVTPKSFRLLDRLMTVLTINHMGIVLFDTLATDVHCLLLFQISLQKIGVMLVSCNSGTFPLVWWYNQMLFRRSGGHKRTPIKMNWYSRSSCFGKYFKATVPVQILVDIVG